MKTTITARPMQGPLPLNALVGKGKRARWTNERMRRLAARRAAALAPEYRAAAFEVADTLDGAYAILAWQARMLGTTAAIPVWKCTDTGRWQVGY